MRLLTNLSIGDTNGHVASFGGGDMFLLKFEADKDAAMDETVRLYGKHFGLELRDYMEYPRWNPKRYNNGRSLWTDDTHTNLSPFWRLYEYHCLEMAKA